MSKLLPSLQAATLTRALTEYLTTTFDLTDKETRQAAHTFITDPHNGIFHGPYLNLTLPYAPGKDNTAEVFDWYDGYPPYTHQTQAFARLTSKNHTPQPTLITTGTGSGKTESFLYPILDHIHRIKTTQPTGIKALIIYPMNALAADQASRLTHILADHPELGITAGIYTGEHKGERTRVTHNGLINNRAHLRSTPPDILLTNYKMLDQLLLRPDDATLWAASANTLQYLVLDEFHTYDGAQGTDVAMLLRRLGHTLNQHRTTPAPAQHPLGPVTPIATSATLSTDDNPRTMLDFAETVFAQPFHDDALVTDTRLTHEQWKATNTTNPEHTHHVDAIAYRADDANIRIQDWLDAHPATITSDSTTNFTTANDTTSVTNSSGTSDTDSNDYARRIASAVCYALYSPTDRTLTPNTTNPDNPHHATWAWELTAPTTPNTLVAIAQTHPTLDALIHAATSAPRGSIALQDLARTLFPLPPSRRGDDTTWATEAQTYLNYLLALLSYIRINTNRATHPTPNISIHLWLRELNRIDRQFTNTATFRWSDDGPVTDPKQWRPAIYCRNCGRSGWGIVMAPNSTTEPDHRANPRKASLTHDPNFRALISASPEAKHYFDTHDPNPRLQWYNTNTNELSPHPPENNQDHDYQNGIILPVLIDHTLGKAHYICPNCGSMHSIRFLGSAIATQLSVTLSSLFGDDNLDTSEKKTLVFTDSVQDAAHRSSFIQTRSHAMNFRTTLRGNMAPTPTPLPDLIHHIVANATTPRQRYRLLPPDLDDHPDFQKFYSPHPPRTLRKHMEDRLLFDALLEFGTNARYGRTLELTGTATVTINTHDANLTTLGHTAHYTAREHYPSQDTLDGTNRPPNYQAWVHGTLHRIRTQGGIHHKYLDRYLNNNGQRWHIWGGRQRNTGAPAFPRDRQTPAFPYLPGHRPHDNDNLDNAVNPNSWYTTWTSKCLGIPTKDATYATRALLETLAEAGILGETISTTGSRIYGLHPSDTLVSPTQLDTTNDADDHGEFSDGDRFGTSSGDGDTAPQLLECAACSALHAAGGNTLTALTGAPCPHPGCPGTLHPTPIDPNYYQQLYSSHNPQSVISSEHTSLLTPDERARIENGFKGISATSDPTAPNVLVATPTLEMGIDIGDLSTVILSSLPNSVASYQQRVGRAGRAHGNALLLTYVRGRGTNLPKLHNPLSVIAGDVRPPAVFLNAQEILQRQFLAYLLDHLAATTPTTSPSRPGTIQGLFGSKRTTTWLDLAEDELAHNYTHHLDTFLASYPTLTPDTQTYLRTWATPTSASSEPCGKPGGTPGSQPGGEPTLHSFLATARDTWNTRVADLTTKLAILQDTFDTLSTQRIHDPDNTELRRTYYSTRADLKATRNALHDHTTEPWINGLERAGLLPNYTLLDDDVTLDVNITLPHGAEGGFTADTRTYTRSKSNALREFAPGNTFYAHGYEITIDSVELGTRTSNIERWQICPECGHVEIRTQGDTTPMPTACPACHSTTFCDPGQHIDVVELSQVSASISAQHHRIGDKRDERLQSHNIITILPDTQPGTITHSWNIPHTRFGVDFLRNTTVRWLNLGSPTNGAGRTIAGTEYRSDLFRLCSECGHIDHKAGENRPTEHKPWCSLRTKSEERPVTVALSRTLHTQTVILHIPIDFDHNTFVIPSLTAAIQLGLRETLGGTPQHLDVVSVPDTLYNNGHQALMIVDTVPGGTGYLADFSNPTTIHTALTTSRTILHNCPCQHEEQDACHNCLLPFAGTNVDVSRATALDALNRILGINNTDPTPTLEEWQPIEGLLDTPEYNPASSLEGEFYNAFINRLRTLDWTVDERPGNALPYATITTPNRDEWELLSQVSMDRVMPDFVLYHRSSIKDGKRISHRHGDSEICIFLDGREYHATHTHNRVDDDATKRHYLRSNGATVWAITHRDILDFRTSFHGKTMRTDNPTTRATRAHDALHNLQPHFPTVGIDNTFKHVMESDPITQLIDYIKNPKASLWQELGKRLPLTCWQPTCANHLDLTSHNCINAEWAITSTPLSNASYTVETTTPLMAHVNHFTTTGTVTLPTNTQWPASDSPIFNEPHLVWATNLGTPGLVLAARVPANTLLSATTHKKNLPGLEYMLLLDSNSDALELDNGEAWRQWLRLSNLLGLANDTNAVYIGTLDTANNGLLPGGRSYSHWILNQAQLTTPATSAAGTTDAPSTVSPANTASTPIPPAVDSTPSNQPLPPEWQEALDLALDDEAELITALGHANIPLPAQGEELSNGTPVDMVWDQHHAFTYRPTPGDNIDASELLDAGWTLLPYNADDIINYFTKLAKENTR